ncbi:MAG: ABC transporter substrate-binding protein [Candidatus Binatia bacterium]
MKKKIAVFTLCAILYALCAFAQAQQLKNVARIGYLSGLPSSANPERVEALRQGLREIGYVEGQNIAIEYRWGEGRFDRLPKLAAELVGLKVDVIVTHGEAGIRALKRVTKTIPIVVAVTGDLVATGHAASLARPGGNVTNFVDTSPDLSGKRLELLREVVPSLSRAAVVWNGANPVKVLDFKETEIAAHAFGLTLLSLEVKAPKDFEDRFKAATTQGSGALVVLQDTLTISNARAIVDFATKSRLPAMYGSSEFVDVGGLMSYAANFSDLFHRAAVYVEKILNGARPADLPVQQPAKFEFIINLKAAKQIGLTIPPNVLARADRVIR